MISVTHHNDAASAMLAGAGTWCLTCGEEEMEEQEARRSLVASRAMEMVRT